MYIWILLAFGLGPMEYLRSYTEESECEVAAEKVWRMTHCYKMELDVNKSRV